VSENPADEFRCIPLFGRLIPLIACQIPLFASVGNFALHSSGINRLQ
jgi:hypothetical protein